MVAVAESFEGYLEQPNQQNQTSSNSVRELRRSMPVGLCCVGLRDVSLGLSASINDFIFQYAFANITVGLQGPLSFLKYLLL